MTETTNKTNGKKIALIAALVIAVIAIFAGVYFAMAPKTTAGAKEVSIEVIDNEQKSTVYTVHTDAEFLRQAMEEADGLVFEGTEGEYGLVIDTVNGVTADYNIDGAYWAFYVDGEYCMYGIDEQPVADGQAFQIIYTTD